MEIKVYGSNLCPGTMRFLSILTSHGIMPSFINVTGSIHLLKEFLLKRDEAGARHAMSIHMKHLIQTLGD